MLRKEPYVPPETSKIPLPLGRSRSMAKPSTPLTCTDELAIPLVTRHNRLFGRRSARP
jgi:hypothetical protein